MGKTTGLFLLEVKGGKRPNRLTADILPSGKLKWHPKVQVHLSNALLTAFETAKEQRCGLGHFKRLLLAGANPNAKGSGGQRPLDYAAKAGNTRLCALLLGNGANPNLKDNLGFTPLHCAAFYDKAKTFALLLESGADANITDNVGETPLDIAKRRGYTEIVEILKTAKAKTGI
jgi:ankyrin repeat protein